MCPLLTSVQIFIYFSRAVHMLDKAASDTETLDADDMVREGDHLYQACHCECWQ